MGLRCLMGHEYGERETSRDRTQRGNEVVVTVQEYRECSRCGDRRIISENKEVTAGGSPSAEEPSAEASWAPDETDREEDQSTVDAFARSPADPPTEEPMTAAEDDGIILEDEPETPPRGHGEWPEADLGEAEAAAGSEPGPWPDEAEAAAEASEPAPSAPGDGPGDGGPEPADEPAGAVDESEPAGASASDPEPTRRPRPDSRNTEFVCPDCGETWPSLNASLRPGDICPECRQGYLDERVVQ